MSLAWCHWLVLFPTMATFKNHEFGSMRYVIILTIPLGPSLNTFAALSPQWSRKEWLSFFPSQIAKHEGETG